VARIVCRSGAASPGPWRRTGEIVNIPDAYATRASTRTRTPASGFQTADDPRRAAARRRGGDRRRRRDPEQAQPRLHQGGRGVPRRGRHALPRWRSRACASTKRPWKRAHRQGARRALEERPRALAARRPGPRRPASSPRRALLGSRDGDLAGYAVEASPGLSRCFSSKPTGSRAAGRPLAAALAAGRGCWQRGSRGSRREPPRPAFLPRRSRRARWERLPCFWPRRALLSPFSSGKGRAVHPAAGGDGRVLPRSARPAAETSSWRLERHRTVFDSTGSGGLPSSSSKSSPAAADRRLPRPSRAPSRAGKTPPSPPAPQTSSSSPPGGRDVEGLRSKV
jgi:hypothetical protein